MDVKQHVYLLRLCGVSRFSLAVRLVSRGTSVRIRFGSPLIVFTSCGLWTLSCDSVPHNSGNIQMTLIAAHLNAGVILVVTV